MIVLCFSLRTPFFIWILEHPETYPKHCCTSLQRTNSLVQQACRQVMQIAHSATKPSTYRSIYLMFQFQTDSLMSISFLLLLLIKFFLRSDPIGKSIKPSMHQRGFSFIIVSNDGLMGVQEYYVQSAYSKQNIRLKICSCSSKLDSAACFDGLKTKIQV